MFAPYKACGPIKVDYYRVKCKCYAGMCRRECITLDLNRTKLVIGKASSWKSVPRGSGCWVECARVGVTSNQCNTKGKNIVRYNVRGIVDVSWEG